MRGLLTQKQGDKHDALCQRGENDRLRADGSCSAWIASGGFCGFGTYQAHAYCGAECCQTYMYTSCHSF